jgi:hypothetical protein
MELSQASHELKINMGAGRHVLDGWVNVDIARSPAASRDPEIFADARRVPLSDGCAGLIMAIHLLEHFYLWEVDAVLTEWHRLLKRRGALVLEMPDILKCARNLLEGVEGERYPDQMGMWGIYGDPRERNPLMCHRWGWSPQTLHAKLAEHGFSRIAQETPQWHRAGQLVRDMRVVAEKR